MYDFDTVVDRRNTGSLKWDVAENELPMWVADMDFKTAPQIINAISERVSHGVFGYSIIPDEWNDAYISWWDRRHGLKIERDSLIFLHRGRTGHIIYSSKAHNTWRKCAYHDTGIQYIF